MDAENVLTFPSSIESAWPENNIVHAQIFPGKKNGAAVLVLPNWNAKWHGQRGLCEWIQRLGITAVKMSMPFGLSPKGSVFLPSAAVISAMTNVHVPMVGNCIQNRLVHFGFR